MIKYANDRIMYNDYLLNNIDNCIEIFTDLISQLNNSFSMPISENNIKDLQIKKDDLKKLLEKIYILDKDKLDKNNSYVIHVFSEFRNNYQIYFNKLLEMKDFYSKDTIEIIKQMNNRSYFEFAKYTEDVKRYAAAYLSVEVDKLLDLQKLLLALKQTTKKLS